MSQKAEPMTDDELLAGLRRRRRQLVDEYMELLVPGFEHYGDRRLDDMREAGELTIDLLLRALSERRAVTREEVAFSHSYLRRALLRGGTEAECVRAAQVWQQVVYDALDDLAGPEGGALVARLSRSLIEDVSVLSAAVMETVAEIQAALRLTAREGRGELVEDLLAGRPVAPGDRLAAARAAGIDEDAPLLVVSARPTEPLPDTAAGSVAAVALARATGEAVEPLFAIREQDIVLVLPVSSDVDALVDDLARARDRLETDGIPLAVGVSAIHGGRAEIPSAYAEACLARDRLPAAGGLLAIAVLGLLDYLLVRGGDATAWSLVPDRIREFVDGDLAQAGLLVDTFEAYLAASLNVKLAAERLFVHTNTAHYRLAKIEAATGCDLRDLDDLQEIAIAIRLARHRAR